MVRDHPDNASTDATQAVAEGLASAYLSLLAPPRREGARARAKGRLAAFLAARDHAAFSAMFYAGLRIAETAALSPEDLDFSRGEEHLRVAKGKGNKERVVPMGPKLKRSLRRYLEVRDHLLPDDGSPSPYLFLNEKGERVTENTLRRRLYSWVRKSGIKKRA